MTETNNQERARKAEFALDHHGIHLEDHGEPLRDRIVDLFTDLMHLARLHLLDPEDLVRIAQGHFAEERD